MVRNATSYSGSGLRDWLIQRVSAVIMTAYLIWLTVIVALSPELDFQSWHNLFANNWVRISTLLALLSLIGHAWIGIWTVLTDYVKPACIRLGLEVLVIVALLGYGLWGFVILWSV